MPKNNTSGHTGVCWHEASGKWLARVKCNGVYVFQKTFHDINDAVSARNKSLKENGFHKNHGRN